MGVGRNRDKLWELSTSMAPSALKQVAQLAMASGPIALPTLPFCCPCSHALGQRADSMIKAWTNTADWAFSQKIPPRESYHWWALFCNGCGWWPWKLSLQRIRSVHGYPVKLGQSPFCGQCLEQAQNASCVAITTAIYPFAKHHYQEEMGYGPDLLPNETLGMAFSTGSYLVDRKSGKTKLLCNTSSWFRRFWSPRKP